MKDASSFKISRCQPKDLDQLISFAARMKKEKAISLPLDKAHFLNKYRQYQGSSKSLNLFIVKHKHKEVVACSGYVPFRGLLAKKKIKGIVCTDVVIDPEYRKSYPGLFTLLCRSYQDLVLKDKFFLLLFPLKDQKIIQAYKKVSWDEFAWVYELWKPLFSRTLPNLDFSSINLQKIDCFDQGVNSLFKRLASQHHFTLHADCDFLNWKYCFNPHSNYVIIKATKNKKDIGYLVAEKRNVNIHVLDIIADLEYPQSLVLMVYKALEHFDLGKAGRVICCISHKQYLAILIKMGFVVKDKHLGLYFKIALLFSKNYDQLPSLDKDLYHLNGFSRQLY